MRATAIRRVLVLSILIPLSFIAAQADVGSDVTETPETATTQTPISTQDSTPQLVPLRGLLIDNSGTPLNGLQTMTFALYDSPTAGTLPASYGPVEVSVTDGTYEVETPAQSHNEDSETLQDATPDRIPAVIYDPRPRHLTDSDRIDSLQLSSNEYIQLLRSSGWAPASSVRRPADTESVNAIDATCVPTSLPAGDALRLARKFALHYYWDKAERYYNVPVEWIDGYMPSFFPYVAGSEIIWKVPRYSILDASGHKLHTGPWNLLSLSLGTEGTDHLGWGPGASTQPCVDPSDDDGTVFPYKLTERGCFKQDTANLPLDNHHASSSTPVYYDVFHNCDGNIEINYRFFAYRDDIAFPRFLRGVISDYLGGHWADWEPNVTIVLTTNEVPVYAYYSAHDEDQSESRLRFTIDSPYQPRYLLWDDVRKDSNGHPVVLVAAKKHSAYYSSWDHSVPNLDPSTSPSPTNRSALMRPQFLNYANNLPNFISFLGYSEDVVGESWTGSVSAGEKFTGRHWVPKNFVNLDGQLWRDHFSSSACGPGVTTGKWGQSEGSGCTPQRAQHRVRDFVNFYRKLNALPKKYGTRITDYYATRGPRYAKDLNLGAADSDGPYFHNVYYSILRPLGFSKTAEFYKQIRFTWWNTLKGKVVATSTDEERTNVRLALQISNSGADRAYGFGIKARLQDGSEIARNVRNTQIESGTSIATSLDLPYTQLPQGRQRVTLDLYGPFDIGTEDGTARPRRIDVLIHSTAVTINRPPIAVVRVPEHVTVQSGSAALVTLDGTASSDPDSESETSSDIARYEWLDNGISIASGPVAMASLDVGTHVISLVVSDRLLLRDTETAIVHVEGLQAPIDLVLPERSPIGSARPRSNRENVGREGDAS